MDRRQVEERTVLLVLTGSRGYGLATEQSDYDYRGVFIATKPYYLGFGLVVSLAMMFLGGILLFLAPSRS